MDALPATAKRRLLKRAQPTWVSPMLATISEERFTREGWLFERKLDGERCLAFCRGRDLRLLSRNRKRLNEKYPEIAEAFRQQEIDTFIADGEIVAFKGSCTRFRCGSICSTCSTWTDTTRVGCRFGTARNFCTTPSTSSIHCGLWSIAKGRGKLAIEKRAGEVGKVSSQRTGIAPMCRKRRATG